MIPSTTLHILSSSTLPAPHSNSTAPHSNSIDGGCTSTSTSTVSARIPFCHCRSTLSAPWLLVASVDSLFTVFTNRNPQTSTCIILVPIQAIERKVSIIVSLILDCRGSCGGLVAEDGGGGLFFYC